MADEGEHAITTVHSENVYVALIVAAHNAALASIKPGASTGVRSFAAEYAKNTTDEYTDHFKRIYKELTSVTTGT
jgi:hypothetical protein